MLVYNNREIIRVLGSWPLCQITYYSNIGVIGVIINTYTFNFMLRERSMP